MSKKTLRYGLNIVLLLAILAVTFTVLLKDQEIGKIMHQIEHAKKTYIFYAALMMCIYVCSEAVIIHSLLKGMAQEIKLRVCIGLSCIGFFFSAITPGASGGQPLQVFYMSKYGVDTLVATLVCIVLVVFFKTMMLLFCGVFMIIEPDTVFTAIGEAPLLFTYGFIGNLVFIASLLLFIFKPSLAFAILSWLIRLGGRMKILKNPNKTLGKTIRSLRQYEKGAKYIKTHTSIIPRIALITFIQRIAYFSICYMIYRSFGMHGTSWSEIIALQVTLAIMVDSLPIPGAVGANESIFCVLFRRVFGDVAVISGLLLNRGITYYALVIVTAVVTCITHVYIMKHKHEVSNKEKKGIVRKLKLATGYAGHKLGILKKKEMVKNYINEKMENRRTKKTEKQKSRGEAR